MLLCMWCTAKIYVRILPWSLGNCNGMIKKQISPGDVVPKPSPCIIDAFLYNMIKMIIMIIIITKHLVSGRNYLCIRHEGWHKQ